MFIEQIISFISIFARYFIFLFDAFLFIKSIVSDIFFGYFYIFFPYLQFFQNVIIKHAYLSLCSIRRANNGLTYQIHIFFRIKHLSLWLFRSCTIFFIILYAFINSFDFSLVSYWWIWLIRCIWSFWDGFICFYEIPFLVYLVCEQLNPTYSSEIIFC